jgi:hypothetical protein|tara:strand:+ start:7333 stop:7659 length:327 start_codon:yes stop_codon:yes gene_type:complete
MVLSKTKLYVILLILAGIIGFLIYNAFQSRAAIEAALKEKQIEKEEVIRIRDSARTARDRQIADFEWDFDSLSKANKKIIYVPYEKLKYVDRTLVDAINILDSTNYEQ